MTAFLRSSPHGAAPPYAPWRAGAPRFVPALAPIDPALRLSPDPVSHVLGWKSAMLDAPERVFRCAPDGRAAAEEAALSVEAELGAPPSGDLVAASRLVSDDLVVMRRRGGEWTCTALTLTAPTFFSIDHAFEGGLAGLHAPVPDGARLADRIGRVFEAIRPGQVLERFNWTLQYGAERFTPDAAPLRAAARAADPKDAPSLLHTRVERQTVSRLPATRAVLFTIRVAISMTDATEPADRPLLAAAWRGLGEKGRAYKGWAACERLAEAQFIRWGV